MKISHRFSNVSIYTWDLGEKRINIEITRIRDRKGVLLRVQSSITNDFECYKMEEVKQTILKEYNKLNA